MSKSKKEYKLVKNILSSEAVFFVLLVLKLRLQKDEEKGQGPSL